MGERGINDSLSYEEAIRPLAYALTLVGRKSN